jgi:hypothetical protein
MGKFKNPLLEENFSSGGGLWNDRIVLITATTTRIDHMKYGSGQMVTRDDGTESTRHVLAIKGIAVDEEKEREETYSAGQTWIPTPDGEGFVKFDGSPGGTFSKTSEIAEFLRRIRAGGFDPALLFDEETGRTRFSGLIGAKFHFEGIDKKDREGKPKLNKKGYVQQAFYPTIFVGQVGGGAKPNGSAAPDELRAKAVEIVVGILTESEGRASRAEVVRRIGLSKDPDTNKLIALLASGKLVGDGVPWVTDGTGYRLGA